MGPCEEWARLPPPAACLYFIYREFKCVEVEELPYLTGYGHEASVRAAQRKYPYYRWLT
jgi:hypothetical protein